MQAREKKKSAMQSFGDFKNGDQKPPEAVHSTLETG